MSTEPSVEYMRITGRWWELDTVTEVARAVGMVAAQLDCETQDAAVAIRGHAAAHAQDPVDVAVDILHRDLAFTP